MANKNDNSSEENDCRGKGRQYRWDIIDVIVYTSQENIKRVVRVYAPVYILFFRWDLVRQLGIFFFLENTFTS